MQDKTFEYNGQGYTIPARELMRLICGIEDIITLIEIQEAAIRGTVKIGRIARAYAYVLSWVGVNKTELEVYYEFLTPREGDKPGENLERTGKVLTDIIGLMSPPKAFAEKLSTGNAVAPVVSSGAQSKKHIRRGSHGHTRLKTSGR